MPISKDKHPIRRNPRDSTLYRGKHAFKIICLRIIYIVYRSLHVGYLINCGAYIHSVKSYIVSKKLYCQFMTHGEKNHKNFDIRI